MSRWTDRIEQSQFSIELKQCLDSLKDAEGLTEGELEILHQHYAELAELTRKDESLTKSHSIEEAGRRSARKLKG